MTPRALACALVCASCVRTVEVEGPAASGSRIVVVEDRVFGSDDVAQPILVALTEGARVLVLDYPEPLSSYGFDPAHLDPVPNEPVRTLFLPSVARTGVVDAGRELALRLVSRDELEADALFRATRIAEVTIASCLSRGGCLRVDDPSLCKLPCNPPPAPPELPGPVEQVRREGPCPAGWSLVPIASLTELPLAADAFSASVCIPASPVACDPSSAWFGGAGACRRVGPECPSRWPDDAAPNDLFVDDDADAGDGTRDAPFKTITRALEARTSTHGAVVIAAGSYPEHLLLDESIVVRGVCTNAKIGSIAVRGADVRISGVSLADLVVGLTATVAIDGVIVEGGALVTDGTVTAAELALVRCASDGIVVGNGHASFEQLAIVTPGARGMYVAGGEVSISDAAIVGPAPGDWSAIEVGGGGFTLSRAAIFDMNQGVYVSHTATATLTDVAISGVARLSGVAIRTSFGAHVFGSNLVLRANRGQVVRSDNRARMELEDVTIVGALPDREADVLGQALGAYDGGRLSVHRAAIVDFDTILIEVREDSEAELYDVAGAHARGASATAIRSAGSSLSIERATLEALASSVFFANLPRMSMPDAAALTLRDVDVTQGGRGLLVERGARAVVERLAFHEMGGAAIHVFDSPSHLRAVDLFVDGVHAHLDDSCDLAYQCNGLGLYTEGAADIDLSRFEIRNANAVAVLVAKSAHVLASEGRIADSAIAVQTCDDASARRALGRVLLERNGADVSCISE